VCRAAVARFIARRDGHACDVENLFLTDGASPGVHYIMKSLLRTKADCILTPIPQYPLYSATITLYGGTLLPYYLDEASGWGLDVGALTAAVATARRAGQCVRALCVINPGNPTGQCLSRSNQEDVLRLCAAEGIVLLADEVYQDNVYAAGKEFTSFKKVAAELNLLDAVPLVSFNSISKGAVGECGRRGGYMEITGVDEAVKEQILKLASINLCPNVSGQVCTALVCDPPAAGEPSFERYSSERAEILASLKRRAATITAALNSLEGVACNAAEGAMYVFPRLTLPPRAVAAADAAGKPADFFYCWRLLEATGITVVPGSGFGQRDGTWHFRTTFLPPEADMEAVCKLITDFHARFMDEFRN
jgi:alanine transaminase